MSLTSSSRSQFSRIFSGHTGLDPYTTAVSDVYQDLFEEGSYTGKGLYDVDAFEASLAGRIPENLVLSHDLLEGLHARTALVTDVEFLDEYPSHYDSYAMRQHRWTRGDWQIARWLLQRVHDANGVRVPNRLPLIARWKILDNLRRSLVAPAMLIWLAAAWTLLSGPAVGWTLVVVTLLAFPIYSHVTNALLFHPRSVPWTSHFWSIWGDLGTHTAQVGFSILLLAHQAYLQAHAVVVTLYRRLISKRYLLEWMTAAQSSSESPHNLEAFWKLMWPTALISGALAVVIAATNPSSLLVAAPFLVFWAASPILAFLLSCEIELKETTLSKNDEHTTRLLARRTWNFFETFVGEDDNWLAPDNYQEDPRPVVAHRTSPTDIGLLLLSTAAARDFGYVGVFETVERLELTFASMAKLDRFHGHFLNWYDTRTLEPLTPQYVSTVDSGNLAGHLIPLKQFCVELLEQRSLDDRCVKGMLDTVALMRQETARIGTIRQSTGVITVKQLLGEIEASEQTLSAGAPKSYTEWLTLIQLISRRTGDLEDMINALSHEHGAARFDRLKEWNRRLDHQVREQRRDLATLAPWTFSSRVPGTTAVIGSSEEIASEWTRLIGELDRVPVLSEIPSISEDALNKLDGIRKKIERSNATNKEKALRALETLNRQLSQSSEMASS